MSEATWLSLLWAGVAVVVGAGVLWRTARRATPPVPPPVPNALSAEADRFIQRVVERMDAAESEIRDLKGQVRELQQQNLIFQQRELDWRATYLALVSMYNALVARLGPEAANAPPPPDPPPPPEGWGGGGGLLTTGPSPRPRQVPSGALNELLDVLAGTLLAGPVTARDSLLTGLPPGYRQSLQRPAGARADLADMVERAALYGGDPPLLGAWLDNVESSLGVGSEPQERVRKWRLRNRW